MNQLESQLAELKTFIKAKEQLEQYLTPAKIAAKIVTENKEQIVEKTILDLGAGTGMLGIAALLIGAKKVIFIEEDKDAIILLEENLEKFGLSKKAKIVHKKLHLTDEEADSTIMNPPFGTRKRHADREFLDYAITHSNFVISMHKTSTIDAIKKHIQDLGANMLSYKDLEYTLDNTMSHHTKERRNIKVSLIISQNI